MTFNRSKVTVAILSDASVSEKLVKKIASTGVITSTYSSTSDSLVKISENIPSLIFIDARISPHNGLFLLSKIRTDDKLREIPVVALTNCSSYEIGELLEKGATDYVTDMDSIPSILSKFINIINTYNTNLIFSDSESENDIKPNSLTGIRIFVIEDDPLLKKLLSARFNKSSFPYEFNSNGLDVLFRMRQFKPDIILLDIRLPGVDGLDLLAEIRRSEDFSTIPVIVFSNIDSQEHRQRAVRLGAGEFYVKALTDLSKLVDRIEELVASRSDK